MNNDLLEELVKTNKEILRWIKFANIGNVQEVLIKTLDTPNKLVAYQLSDGNNTSTTVSEKAKASQTTVSRWWRNWIKLGIADSISMQGGARAKRIFDLEDFGISVPNLQEDKQIEGSCDDEKQNV